MALDCSFVVHAGAVSFAPLLPPKRLNHGVSEDGGVGEDDSRRQRPATYSVPSVPRE